VYEYARRDYEPVPEVRIRRHLRFVRDDVAGWIAAQRESALPPRLYYMRHRDKARRLLTLAAPFSAWASLIVLAAVAESYLTAHTAALVSDLAFQRQERDPMRCGQAVT